MPPTNNNEYDDEAFTQASNELQGNLTPMLDQLWDAGASPEDIQNEIANAISNTEAWRDQPVAVEIRPA